MNRGAFGQEIIAAVRENVRPSGALSRNVRISEELVDRFSMASCSAAFA
jgi:hypothetical protein